MNPTDRKWLRSPSERLGTLSHADLPPPATEVGHEEQQLLGALRNGDEAAFEWLLDRLYAPMLRLARSYVRSSDEAEEVVQDTWLGVIAGLDRFEGRSSLKTWIFQILVNRARSRARREARQMPFSSLVIPGDHGDRDEPVADWLLAEGASSPLFWHGEASLPAAPDEVVLAEELRLRVETAIGELPKRQRMVITLRDLDGWSPEEVCASLEISEGNQRVLLHRARMKVREALGRYLRVEGESPTPSVAV